MVQVHRGETLVEWQLGDGVSRLYYGATVADSSCPWQLAQVGQRDTTAWVYTLTPDQQRAVRDARLHQGTYATGYLALQQALRAPDLRSFGANSQGKGSFVVLSYTDTTITPHRQILLRIDPDERQLHIVQAVIDDGGRTSTFDLWRLQVRDVAATIPPGLPRWPDAKETKQLLDPACPALDTAHVLSLRTLLDSTDQLWYLPRSLPQDVKQAAVLTFPLRDPSTETAHNSIVLLGTDRWLSISAGSWTPNATATTDLQRSGWRYTVTAQSKDGWNATLRRLSDGIPAAFVPTITITSQGWKEDEILALIDSLATPTGVMWNDLHARFLEPSPLFPAVQNAVDRSLAALQAPTDRTLHSQSTSYYRPAPTQPTLSDPYHVDDQVRSPTTLQQQQWLSYSGGKLAKVYDIFAGPTGATSTSAAGFYKATVGDAARLTFDYRAQGWAGVDAPAQPDSFTATEQPGVEMLENVLHDSAPISLTNTADGLQLEQVTFLRMAGLGYEFFSHELPVPWTGDLADGQVIRRLTLDRTSFIPRRLEIVSHNAQAEEILLFKVDLQVHQVGDAPPASQMRLPPSDDEVTFNSTAYRWRRARLSVPPLSIHWLMSNLDSPPGPSLSNGQAIVAPLTRVLTWPPGLDPAMMWHLFPATSVDALQLGVFQTNTWDDLTQLSSVDRSQYREPGGQNNIPLRVTQGPTPLIDHILRYPPLTQERTDAGWTQSERLTVQVAGQQRVAWLLYNDEIGALVIDVDGQTLHIVGAPDFLKGPILNLLPQMIWTNIGP